MHCASGVVAQFLDADLAHAKFLDLARHRHRKLIHKLEMLGRLEVRDPPLAPGLQLQLVGLFRHLKVAPMTNHTIDAATRTAPDEQSPHGRVIRDNTPDWYTDALDQRKTELASLALNIPDWYKKASLALGYW